MTLNTKSDQLGFIGLILIILVFWDPQYALLCLIVFGSIIAIICAINLICDLIDWIHKPKKNKK